MYYLLAIIEVHFVRSVFCALGRWLSGHDERPVSYTGRADMHSDKLGAGS
jgi:hypothetical protein